MCMKTNIRCAAIPGTEVDWGGGLLCSTPLKEAVHLHSRIQSPGVHRLRVLCDCPRKGHCRNIWGWPFFTGPGNFHSWSECICCSRFRRRDVQISCHRGDLTGENDLIARPPSVIDALRNKRESLHRHPRQKTLCLLAELSPFLVHRSG